MSFQSLAFLAFLAIAVPACLLASRHSRRTGMTVLGIASLVFYVAGGGWDAFSVLCAGTLVSILAVQQLWRESEGRRRRRVLVLAAGYHIAVLLVFKYAGFFTGGRVSLGWVPLGLSFFTFQQLWLLKEVYTGQFRLRSGELLPLYTFFFPTVTSGPILRPGAFFPQLTGEKFLRPGWEDAAAGLYGICCGTVKKVLLADSFGVIVNNGWERLGDLTAPGAWLVILGYTLQLYFDFSGYCDIAAGCARLLGIRLPVNFDSPYRSLSIGEFWKRWHITLTTFLRECLYFPLGGSKKGAARTYLNILIIFLVSGFWHGAGWTFLFWGLLHGLGQVAERLLGGRLKRIPKPVRWCLTFAFVNVAWVFFRAPDFAGALRLLATALTGVMARPGGWLLHGLFSKETGAIQMLLPAVKPWMDLARVALLYGTGMAVVLLPVNTAARMERFRPKWWQAAALAVLTAWSVLSFTGITTFIYSNF